MCTRLRPDNASRNVGEVVDRVSSEFARRDAKNCAVGSRSDGTYVSLLSIGNASIHSGSISSVSACGGKVRFVRPVKRGMTLSSAGNLPPDKSDRSSFMMHASIASRRDLQTVRNGSKGRNEETDGGPA